MAVFEPNYRGSDNFGNDFSRAIVDDSGDGPGRDVFAGLDMLKKRGIVDESNIAVTGWSYGGYMTNWLIGHAQFWKAAIAGAPVTNLLDQYALSDSNVSRATAIGGSPYTGDWMKHWVEQSPITYYDKMTTPTLVLQDVGDYRVTITRDTSSITRSKIAVSRHGSMPIPSAATAPTIRCACATSTAAGSNGSTNICHTIEQQPSSVIRRATWRLRIRREQQPLGC